MTKCAHKTKLSKRDAGNVRLQKIASVTGKTDKPLHFDEDNHAFLLDNVQLKENRN